MFKRSAVFKRQHWGYLFAIIIALIMSAYLLMPGYAWLHAAGPMNAGHEELVCEDCHVSAEGSLRQQFQANIQFLLGNLKQYSPVGFRSVSSRDCQQCHERPTDRHPVSRFLEPRFSKARAKIAPHQCVSCHKEHQGKRVTTVSQNYCANCHKKLKLKKEKIDVPHADLVKHERWQTCLGCHDYHGNHRMKLKTQLKDAFNEQMIREYFNGGHDPYSRIKIHKAIKGDMQ